MSNSRYILLTFVIPGLLLILGGVVLVWPNYARIADVRSEITNLQSRIDQLSEKQKLVEDLTASVASSRERNALQLKEIPEDPNTAELMRTLSLPVDGFAVFDQGYTTGTAKEAVDGENTDLLALPLTVDMTGRFDSAFAVLRAAESMDRLVRVTSVRLSRHGENAVQGQPGYDERTITASLVLEAIYAPPTDDGDIDEEAM